MHCTSILTLSLLIMGAIASDTKKETCFDWDTDYPGNDINLDLAKNIHLRSSAAECQDLCSITEECEYFTWAPTHRCYLKHSKSTSYTWFSKSTQTYEKGAISGPKYCKGFVWEERTNTFSDSECPNIGNNPGLEISECKDKCDNTPACNAINVRTEGRTLKSWILQSANLGQNKDIKDCILHACPFEELQNPKWKVRGFKSYFKNFDGCSEDTIDDICSCGRNLDPVCAGGLFYDNFCLYECAKKEAECTGDQGFPEVAKNDEECHQPTQEPKIEGCSEKEVNDSCFCTKIYDPVCSGGVTYGNPCTYQCAKKKALCDGDQEIPKITKYGDCLED